MIITCPACHFSKEIASSRIPPGVKFATCPMCKNKFVIRVKAEIGQTPNAPSAGKPNQPSPGEKRAASASRDKGSRRAVAPVKAKRKAPAAIADLELVPLESEVSCPRCRRRQPNSTECIYCGLIFSKYRQRSTSDSLELVPLKNSEDQRAENVERALGCISRGKPIEFLDLLGNILSIPSKALLLSAKIDSHMISSKTEELMLSFIIRHDLYDVRVRLNEFAPMSELKRIFKPNNMNIIIRVFFGFLSVLIYLFNPGRIFGGDFYNPATKTVNLFSDHPGVALHELGHALDFKRRKYPGLYQLFRFIPFVALYQEFIASKYAVQFLKEKGFHKDELKAYKILYPAYSTYLFGAFYEVLPSPLLVFSFLPFIIAGHIAGNIHALLRRLALVEKGDFEGERRRGDTSQIIMEKVRARRFRFDRKIFLSMICGFFIGSAIFGLAGALLGALISYALAQEIIKYRKSDT
jgi:hypothetical protein